MIQFFGEEFEIYSNLWFQLYWTNSFLKLLFWQDIATAMLGPYFRSALTLILG